LISLAVAIPVAASLVFAGVWAQLPAPAAWSPDGAATAQPQAVFSDIDPAAPQADAISWAVHNELLSGYPDGTFQPDAMLSRSAAAPLLERFARLEGFVAEPSTGTDCYQDIAADVNAEAICWLRANRLSVPAADEPNLFYPSNPLGRGAMASLVFRLATQVAGAAAPSPCVSRFRDVPRDHPHLCGTAWLQETTIASTITQGDRYRPSQPITRGEAAAVMYAFADWWHRQVRIATYNIRQACVAEDMAQGLSWQERAKTVAATILAAAPDVLAVQEASTARWASDKSTGGDAAGRAAFCERGANDNHPVSQYVDLVSRLPGYQDVGAGSGGVHILVKRASVAVLDAQVLAVSHNSTAQPAPTDRTLVVAHLALVSSGAQFAVATTHLLSDAQDPNYEEGHNCNSAATQETRDIVHQLEAYQDLPLYLMGDFNNPFTGTCTPYEVITTGDGGAVRPLVDAQRAVIESGHTTNGKRQTINYGFNLERWADTSTTDKHDRIYADAAITVLAWVNTTPKAASSDHNLVWAATLLP
jgi:endonuclease/exonuclease/phosphatase family metal-dependent hydrolase